MTGRPARMAGTVRSPSSALARAFRAARGAPVQGGTLVREADAAALVADAAMALARRGHAPVVTHANGPALVRLAALMLDGFGIGTTDGPQEDS